MFISVSSDFSRSGLAFFAFSSGSEKKTSRLYWSFVLDRFDGFNHIIAPDLYLYERQDFHISSRLYYDTLGPVWMLAWSDDPNLNLSVKINGQWQKYTTNNYIFMPPYSIVQWHLPSGSIHWNAFVSSISKKKITEMKPFLLHSFPSLCDV